MASLFQETNLKLITCQPIAESGHTSPPAAECHTDALLSTHADRQSVDISFTVCLFVCVCVCVCVFVRLRISPVRIKPAASKFALWFIGVLGRECPILGNFAPP